MLKTVELLGVRMNDNYVREIMGQVIQLEDRPGMSTLEIMTADLLLACQEHASWMEWYHQRDLVLPGDIALLEAEGRNVPGRRKELQERAFLRECMGYAQQRGKRVYLLAASAREANRAAAFLKVRFPKLKLVGVSALGEDGKDADGVVNEINWEEPDFVLSLLGMPLAMDFLEKEQERINAGFWCGLGREYLSERRLGLRARLKGHLDKNKLARSISRYDEGEHAYRAKERD